MSFLRRNAALSLAVLLGIFLALARYAGSPGAIPAPAPAAAPAPHPLAKARRAVPRKLAAKPGAPSEPAKVRGAGLREVGEAFGGRPPTRVDTSAPSDQ